MTYDKLFLDTVKNLSRLLEASGEPAKAARLRLQTQIVYDSWGVFGCQGLMVEVANHGLPLTAEVSKAFKSLGIGARRELKADSILGVYFIRDGDISATYVTDDD